MARGRGSLEVVKTSAGNVFQRQALETGQIVYRKNGKFTSARAFTSAKSAQGSAYIPGGLDRAPGLEDEIPPRTAFWVPGPRTPNTIAGRRKANDFGRVGPLGSLVLPHYAPGELVENERDRQILVQDGILQRSFLGFWRHPNNSGLGRDEAEEKFLRFIGTIRGVSGAQFRDDIREEFGIGRYETF